MPRKVAQPAREESHADDGQQKVCYLDTFLESVTDVNTAGLKKPCEQKTML